MHWSLEYLKISILYLPMLSWKGSLVEVKLVVVVVVAAVAVVLWHYEI